MKFQLDKSRSFIALYISFQSPKFKTKSGVGDHIGLVVIFIIDVNEFYLLPLALSNMTKPLPFGS